MLQNLNFAHGDEHGWIAPGLFVDITLDCSDNVPFEIAIR